MEKEEAYAIERFMAMWLWEYQRKVRRQIHIAARRDFGMKRVELAIGEYGPDGRFEKDFEEFADKVDAAEDSGRITPEQTYDLLGAHVLMSGTRKSDGKPMHVVAEVSIAICAGEIRRAAYLGSILSAVTEEPSIAAAIGDSIAPSGRRLAERLGVTVSLIRPPIG